MRLYSALLRTALADLPEGRPHMALDTTVLWGGFCGWRAGGVEGDAAQKRRGARAGQPGGRLGEGGQGTLGHRQRRGRAGTLRDYGLRFCIEEGFLDRKSGGFQWESSKLRDAGVLRRLCLVMAVATLVPACQGVAVAAAGKRRQADPHWFRGLSYARIGWNWIRRAAACGDTLIDRLALLTTHDPEPARASRRQADRSRWMDGLPWRYVFVFSLWRYPRRWRLGTR